MADTAVSTEDISLSEKGCRKRKLSEQSYRDIKKEKVPVSILREENSVSSKQDEYRIPMIQQTNSYFGNNFTHSGGVQPPIPIIPPNFPFIPNCLPTTQNGLMTIDPNMVPFMGYDPRFNYPGTYGMGIFNPGPPPPYYKEVITLQSCVLYPPDPSAIITRREKPSGCRTIFVGTLPEKITEQIIKEIFSTCGEVVNVRMHQRNFCHVRFSCQEEVEKALQLSGYHLRIENKNESFYSSHIHVDYAVSKMDKIDEEKAERRALREARHKTLRELEALAIPMVPPFSDVELKKLMNQFRSGVFKDGVLSLTTWMEKGEVNKKNAGKFFTIIQNLKHNIGKLVNEKVELEKKYNNEKSIQCEKILSITLLMKDIERTFALAKCQNNMAKSQTLMISKWHKVASKNATTEIVEENEREMRDQSVSPKNTARLEEVEALQDQIKEAKKALAVTVDKITNLKAEKNVTVEKYIENTKNLSTKLQCMKEEYNNLRKKLDVMSVAPKHSSSSSMESCSRAGNSSAKGVENFNREARLLGLIIQFLIIHPFEVNINYISSYLDKLVTPASPAYVISLMRRYPSLFQEKVTGVGATLERKWSLIKKVPQSE